MNNNPTGKNQYTPGGKSNKQVAQRNRAEARMKTASSSQKKAFWQVRKHDNAGVSTVAKLDRKSDARFSSFRAAEKTYFKRVFKAK